MGIPLELALASVDKRLHDEGIRSRVSLVAGGSVRNSADVVRAVALGADAVYCASAALIAMGCHQCQDCASGRCNWGIATQRPELTKRLNPEVAAERVASINPSCIVRPRQCFFLPETADQFDFAAFDYVIDAVDTVSAKIALVEAAFAAGVPIVSSMGAGNKLDPTAFRVTDIYETSVDPLARVMRRELRRRGIPSLKVVYSTEPPLVPADDDMAVKDGARPAPGSVAFVPSVAGLILGGEVVKDLAAC